MMGLMSLTWCAVLCSAQPRRGPPRGPVKEAKSAFFGKEGESVQSRGPGSLTIMIAVAITVLFVVLKVVLSPSRPADEPSKAQKKKK